MMAAPYFINNKEECGNGFLRIDVTSTYYIDKRFSYHHSHDHHHTYLHSHGSCSPLSLFLTIHALLREIHIAELLDPKCGY